VCCSLVPAPIRRRLCALLPDLFGALELVVGALTVAAQPLVERVAVDVAELELLGDVRRDRAAGGFAVAALCIAVYERFDVRGARPLGPCRSGVRRG
jgi:hypothetical protein